MSKQGSLRCYMPPRVRDYGDLVGMTAGVHLLLGTAGTHDLSFSTPAGTASGAGAGDAGGQSQLAPTAGSASGVEAAGTDGTAGPAANGGVAGVASGGGAPAGGDSPGGASGGGGGGSLGAGAAGGGSAGGGSPGGGSSGGGTLPFTGFAAGAAALVGGALTAAGAALRRGTSSRSRRP